MSVTADQRIRLKYVAPLRNERATANSAHTEYLGLENIESWTGKLLTKPDAESTEDACEEGTANVFHPDDVLFGKLRPYLAKAWHADRDGVCTTELLVLEPKEKLWPRYLLYLLLSPKFVYEVDSSTFGAKMPRANWDFIGNLKVTIPPLETQRRIADYLDRETAHIDALIAEKERMLSLLEEKRTALISRAVTRGLDPDAPMKPSGLDWLGDIPAHWDVLRLGYLVNLNGGMTPSKERPEYWDGDIPWASPKDIKNRYVSDTIDHVTDRAIEETGMGIIEPPVLLLVVRGMILAKNVPTSVSKVPLTINQDMKALRPSTNRLSVDYLKLLFDGLQQQLMTLVEESAHGTRCLRTDLLNSFKVPLPPYDEQVSILDVLKKEDQRLENIGVELQRSVQLLKERCAAIITAAVTGQIDLEEMAA